jgi:hypothetical protein
MMQFLPAAVMATVPLNAGLALIASMQPQSKMEALIAVQIVATGFSGLRFLRQSHVQINEDYIEVYAISPPIAARSQQPREAHVSKALERIRHCAVTHPRREPCAGKPHVRIWAGGVR